MRCGFPFPAAPDNCKGALSYIDNPAHVRGLASGGHAVVNGNVFLCEWHCKLVCMEMLRRGVSIVARPLPS